MQNKLYTIIANIYNEIKNFKGERATLQDAIEETVLQQVGGNGEIIGARGGHQSIDDRLRSMESIVNTHAVDTNMVLENVEQTKLEILARMPENVTEVIRDASKEMLISLENKVRTREDFLSVGPNQTALLPGLGMDYISKAYVKTTDSIVPVSSILFDSTEKAAFDENKSQVVDGAVRARIASDLFSIPLETAERIRSEVSSMDAVAVPGHLSAVANYTSKAGAGHLANIFNSNLAWVVANGNIRLDFSFQGSVQVKEVLLNITSTSSTLQYKVQYSQDGALWTEAKTGTGNLVASFFNALKMSYLRIELTTAAGETGKTITLSNLQIKTLQYESKSGLIVSTKPVIATHSEEDILIQPRADVMPSLHSDARYALSVWSSERDERETLSYIPEIIAVTPNLFRDESGMSPSENTLSSRHLRDLNAKLCARFLDVESTGLTLSGEVGTVSIDRATYAEDVANAWQTDDQVAMGVEFKLNGTRHVVAISEANLNGSYIVTVGGVELKVRILVSGEQSLRVDILPIQTGQDIIAEDISIVFHAPLRQEETTIYTQTDSSTSVSYKTIDTKDRSIQTFAFGSDYRTYDYHENEQGQAIYNYSPFNRSVSGFAGTIIGKDVYAGRYSSAYDNEDITNAVRLQKRYGTKKNCGLPATVFLATDTSHLEDAVDSHLQAFFSESRNPVFSPTKTYETKTYIANQKISNISPREVALTPDAIRYALSFDGDAYYVFDVETDTWVPFAVAQMTSQALTSIPEGAFEKIRHGSEWLYLKIIFYEVNSEVSQIDVQMQSDAFVVIEEGEVQSKGMTLPSLQRMKPGTLRADVLSQTRFFYLATSMSNYIPSERYAVSGHDVLNWRDVRWQEIDNVTIKEYDVGYRALSYENLTTEPVILRVVRTLIENRTGVIDTTDSLKDEVLSLTEQQKETLGFAKLLQQNVGLLHESFVNTGSVPVDLPTVLLPDIKEFESDWVEPDDTFAIESVEKLRGVQVWESKDAYVPYSEHLLLNESTKDRFLAYQTVIENDGGLLASDYDRDNPYMAPEDILSYSTLSFSTHMFDVSSTLAPSNTVDPRFGTAPFQRILDNQGEHGSTTGDRDEMWYVTKHDTVYWDLPGEDQRWVDIVIDFRNNVYIDKLSNVQFGFRRNEGSFTDAYVIAQQITSFAWSLDGKEYETLYTQNGTSAYSKLGINVDFKKELRFVRIRLERPYSSSKGKGIVTFKNVNILYCPVRYVHNSEGYIQNKTGIDTSNWSEFSQIQVDRFIDHNPAEMRFALSDSPNASAWKYWSGATWVTTANPTIASSMSIETLLSLTKTQLDLLNKGTLYIRAIFETTDIFKTPVLRSVSFLHTESESTRHFDIIDPSTAGLRYYENDKRMILQNKSGTKKRFKVILL